jgi:signal transduction histidine kinase
MPKADQVPNSVYSEYRNEVEGERMARSLRVGCAVVAVLSTAFIPLDYAVFRDRFVSMLGFRLFCNGVMILIVLRTARTHPLESAVAGCLTTGAMLLTVIAAAGGIESEYTPGLMLLFLGMPVLLPFTARQAGFIVAVLIGGLAAMPIFADASVGLRTFCLNLIFPLAAGVESIAASALMERMRYADFERRREIEEARDELRKLDKEKSRFTSNIHHELRTPLTLMLAPVDALLAGDFGDLEELPRSYLESVKSNGQRLLKLINSLLDLAKIEGNRFLLRRRPTDVWGVISAYVSSAKPLAEYRQIELSLSRDGDPGPICVDSDAIEKIIANLLANALKFTDAGGLVRVSLSGTEEGGIHVVVSDSGVGLSPDQLETIFDRFAQVDTSNTRKHEGTGIGLALVRELVQLHAGRVWAESTGLGHGAEMHVILPAGEADSETAEDMMSVEPEGFGRRSDPFAVFDEETRRVSFDDRRLSLDEIFRNARRSADSAESIERISGTTNRGPGIPRILVVEDNAEMRRLLAFVLSKEFYVDVARNGREALQRISDVHPELVLTDVMMPEMSGTELCEALKADPETEGIPVILVTSKGDREMKIQGLEIGADDYVVKPFHPAELLARVRSLVRIRRLQKELEIKNSRLQTANDELERALLELREAGSALVQSERLAAVGELAAGVAHEVNNPINFATNALRTLQSYTADICSVARSIDLIDFKDPEVAVGSIREVSRLKEKVEFDSLADSLTELVGIVTEGLERTHRMVADLRDFAKPGEVAWCEIDIGAGVSSTVQLIRYALRDNGVSLSVDIDEMLPTVHGDPRALNQVFLNLLKNSIEAVAESKGSIWLTASAAESEVVIEFRDDGPGIAPEISEKLFDPFFTTKAAGKGTGLGLSISKRVVSEMGGRIELKTAPGSGTVFSVYLPVGANQRRVG